MIAQGYRDEVAGRGKEGGYKGARRGERNVILLVVYMSNYIKPYALNTGTFQCHLDL